MFSFEASTGWSKTVRSAGRCWALSGARRACCARLSCISPDVWQFVHSVQHAEFAKSSAVSPAMPRVLRMRFLWSATISHPSPHMSKIVNRAQSRDKHPLHRGSLSSSGASKPSSASPLAPTMQGEQKKPRQHMKQLQIPCRYCLPELYTYHFRRQHSDTKNKAKIMHITNRGVYTVMSSGQLKS